MGKIILQLDRVMADRKMSLNELSDQDRQGKCHSILDIRSDLQCA